MVWRAAGAGAGMTRVGREEDAPQPPGAGLRGSSVGRGPSPGTGLGLLAADPTLGAPGSWETQGSAPLLQARPRPLRRKPPRGRMPQARIHSCFPHPALKVVPSTDTTVLARLVSA